MPPGWACEPGQAPVLNLYWFELVSVAPRIWAGTYIYLAQ